MKKITALITFATSWMLTLFICSFTTSPVLADPPVRFRLVKDYLIVVPVFVNGQGPFEFLLDTGTNSTVIHQKLAQQLGLRAVDRIIRYTPTGSQVISRASLNSLTVGSRTITNTEVLITEMRQTHLLDSRICGVLGHPSYHSSITSLITSSNDLNSLRAGQPGFNFPVNIWRWRITMKSYRSRPSVNQAKHNRCGCSSTVARQ
jgi:predicted aspartyl protease